MKKLFIFIRLVIFFTIMFALIIVLGKVFTPKWKTGTVTTEGQDFTVRGFYELPKNSIDVLFVGDSGSYKGVSPMEIYEQTGITSYNYSVSSARIYMLYYILKDTLNYQKPKVVVIDPLTYFYQNREDEAMGRKSFDYMNLGKDKIDMINDPIFNFTLKEKLTYVFPLFRYHSRWNEVNFTNIKRTFGNYHSISKGYVMSSFLYPNFDEFNYMEPKLTNIEMKEYVKNYLIKISNLCKENNIDLIILGVPDSLGWNYNNNYKLHKITEELGIKYLDLNNDSYGLDWMTDTEDGGSHLNLFGAKKVTNEITKYLKSNYELEDKRENPNYESWNEDLIKYRKARTKKSNELQSKIDNKKYDEFKNPNKSKKNKSTKNKH